MYLNDNKQSYMHPEKKKNNLYMGTFSIFSEVFFLTLHHYKTKVVYISLKHHSKSLS